ncbi:2698_t:CDS:2 [Dentiscutata erythropus]|uniref:2698_t:CDS:1 n=1 Tax=Dentiscutata erythropus TaxID=1348616 RepID=A0A9N9N5G5_9GLOM|nr:2698_t:CDS:2 [Dentiscutata erythropus]
MKSSQHVESLYSQLKSIESRVTLIDRLLAVIRQQHKEHTQKFEYKTFLHQNRHTQDDKDQVWKSEYGVLKCADNIYDVVQIGDQATITCMVQIGTPSTCTCLYPWHTRTPCQHIIIVYLLYMRTCIPQSEVHKRWHVLHTNCVQDPVPQVAAQIFQKLPECHHNDLINLMQNTQT